MERITTPKTALLDAVKIAGSQSELARRCNTYAPRIHRMISAGRTAAEYVLRIESATGVSRHDLRPDLYPREEAITTVVARDDVAAHGNRSASLDKGGVA